MSEPVPLRLYVVCDGPRDHAAVCRMTERFVGRPIDPECSHWPRLHLRGSGRGYGRKLKYAVRQAITNQREGVIATVDQDKHHRHAKLTELRAAREEDRTEGIALPTALGEAAPHFEAWLLDDPLAVRAGLGLSSDFDIPSVSRTKHPKSVLDELIDRAIVDRQGRDAEILAGIAARIEAERCTHRAQTGFQEFAEELRNEFEVSASRA